MEYSFQFFFNVLVSYFYRQICGITPNGVVVFATSYNYLQKLLDAWAIRFHRGNSALDDLCREFQRPIFVEVNLILWNS